ncbi:MAG: aminopeptidase [Treponema sp.]|nr:aminopeptidase [Treponema sp.]
MPDIRLYHLPPLFAAAALLAVCGLFSGCYTLTQGAAMLGYLNRAVPLEDSGDEDFIRLVTDIRKFAIEELGLKESKNYTRYVEIDRGYLAAVVSASAKDSFSRHEWSYPIVGRLPYKGFFNAEDAKKERVKLEKKDFDVWIRGVDAFSTLGWFRDPLYSFMRDYSPWRLADLIIHELVHATVFIKGQADFNEELAQFIGSEGARLYMETRYGLDSEEYREMLVSEKESRRYVDFIQELIMELNALYSDDTGKNKVLDEKERIINNAKERFDAEYDSRFSNDNYRFFSTLAINNAYLELFRLYYADDNFYENLYERRGRDLKIFTAAAKTVKNGSKPREQLENALYAMGNRQ